MANYCIHCGTVLHPDFGLCPRCSRERLNQLIETRRIQPGYVVPAYAQPAAVSQSVVVRQAPKAAERAVPAARKHKSVFKRLLIAAMTLVLLAMTVTAMGIFAIRQATTEDALGAMVEAVPVSDMTALLGENAEKYVYGPIKNEVLEATGMSMDNATVDRVVEASEFKLYLAEKAAAYARDLYNGTDYFSLNHKEIYNLLRTNRREMEKAVGVSLPDDALAQIADMLSNQELTEQIRLSLMKENTPGVYYTLHFGLSYGAIVILLAVAAMLLLSMLRVDFSLGILGSGIALAVTGGLLAVPALLNKLVPTLLSTLVPNGFLQAVITEFLNANLLVSLLVFTVGVALILVRASVKMLCKLFR